MIKFFRKTRQNMVNENKVSKYLLYAIGEIILVVIGILIALNINNANEKRISNTKITNILKEIKNDLSKDISSSIGVFDQFMIEDSIQDLILNNKHTYEDYKTGIIPILGFNRNDFITLTNGYENLMRNIDNLPKKYESLLDELNNLYVVHKTDIDIYNMKIHKNIYDNIDLLFKQSWVQKSFKGIRTDEEIDFYLNDIRYKNLVSIYMINIRNVLRVSNAYRIDAINTYKKIEELTESNDSIPEFINFLLKDTTLINEIVGNYVLTESIGSGWSDEVFITREGNQLFINDKDNKNLKCYLHKESIYFFARGTKILNFNKMNEFTISRNIQGKATYTKMK
jgi:hypothetical protein